VIGIAFLSRNLLSAYFGVTVDPIMRLIIGM
jgi:hypothetical protein